MNQTDAPTPRFHIAPVQSLHCLHSLPATVNDGVKMQEKGV